MLQRSSSGSDPIGRSSDSTDWDAIIRDPRFARLQRKKQRFLAGLMGLAVVYYFLLPIGATYFQDLFRIRVWGVINVALLFALSQFIAAWLIAWCYARRAGREFDPLAAQIAMDHTRAAGEPAGMT